jgi:hypothetical protein
MTEEPHHDGHSDLDTESFDPDDVPGNTSPVEHLDPDYEYLDFEEPTKTNRQGTKRALITSKRKVCASEMGNVGAAGSGARKRSASDPKQVQPPSYIYIYGADSLITIEWLPRNSNRPSQVAF